MISSISNTFLIVKSQFGFIVVTLVCVGFSCSTDQQTLFSEYPNRGPISNDGYRAILSTTNLAIGENRFSFILTGPDGFIDNEDVLIKMIYIQGSTKAVEYSPVFYKWPDGLRVSYVDFVSFDNPGTWKATITFEDQGQIRSVELVFDVSAIIKTPLVGGLIPLSDSKTIHTVDTLDELSTGSLVHIDLYKMSIREAIFEDKPILIVFSSPAFCLDEVCGPQVEVLKQLAESRADKINSIHVDVYDEPSKVQMDVNSATYSKPFLEWRLESPQWTFLIDCRGKTFKKYQGFVSEYEISTDINEMFSLAEKLTGCSI